METECTEFGCRLEQAKKRIAELEAAIERHRKKIEMSAIGYTTPGTRFDRELWGALKGGE